MNQVPRNINSTQQQQGPPPPPPWETLLSRSTCNIRDIGSCCSTDKPLTGITGSKCPQFQVLVMEITYRLAQPNDFQDVLTLSEGIYSGHDYLPLTFHQWLRRDQTKVLLAHGEGILVGLVVGSVVDDGETCVFHAARVLPEFRGRGIFRQMRKALRCKFIQGTFTALFRERFSTQYASLGQSAGTKQLAEYSVLLYPRVSRAERTPIYHISTPTCISNRNRTLYKGISLPCNSVSSSSTETISRKCCYHL